jgi:hypothetical protein
MGTPVTRTEYLAEYLRLNTLIRQQVAMLPDVEALADSPEEIGPVDLTPLDQIDVLADELKRLVTGWAEMPGPTSTRLVSRRRCPQCGHAIVRHELGLAGAYCRALASPDGYMDACHCVPHLDEWTDAQKALIQA